MSPHISYTHRQIAMQCGFKDQIVDYILEKVSFIPDNSVNVVDENFALWKHTLKSGFLFSEEKGVQPQYTEIFWEKVILSFCYENVKYSG